MKKEIKATESRNTDTATHVELQEEPQKELQKNSQEAQKEKPDPIKPEKPVIVDEAKLKSLEILGPETTGEKLRTVRKVCKISQEELASHTGVSRKTIGQIERGECIPRLETLRQIEDALGLRAYFLSGDDVTGAAERIEEEVAVINFFRELKKKNLTDEEMCRSLSAALTVAEIFS